MSPGSHEVGEAIPLKEALEDSDFLFSTMESAHPQLLAFVTDVAYLTLRDDVGDRIRRSAREGSLALRDFLLVLAEAAAFFGDGHTAVHLKASAIDPQDPAIRMPPFWLAYRAGSTFIAEATPELGHLKGVRLLEIDGRHVLNAIEPMTRMISGEREEAKIAMFMSWQRTYWALCWRTRSWQMNLSYQGEEQQVHRERVELLPIREYDAKVLTPSLRKSVQRRRHAKFHDDCAICYLRYDIFKDAPAEKRFFRSLFKKLRERNTKDLVIDLRENRGGSTNIMEYMLDYLTSKPYRGISRMDVKLSEGLFQQRNEYGKRYRHLEGLVVTHKIKPKLPRDRGHKFKGRLFLITGPQTFSTAAMFALVVKEHGLGTILGEETGGVRETFGDALSFSMPNSGVMFGVSHKHFYPPDPKPEDKTHGVVPDIPVNEEALREFGGSHDPIKEWALGIVRSRH